MKETMETVVRNINYSRAFEAAPKAGEPLHIDVYFVHYDFNRSGWQKAMGEWYTKNIKYSAEMTGVKFWLAKDLLLQGYNVSGSSRFFSREDPSDTATAEELMSARANESFNESEAFTNTTNATTIATIKEGLMGNGGISSLSKKGLAKLPVVDIFSYEYIWFLDEDADFTSIDLRQMVLDARVTRANIVAPSVLFRGEVGDPRLERKEERKRLRTVNVSNMTNLTLPEEERLRQSRERRKRRREESMKKRMEDLRQKRLKEDAERIAEEEERKSHRRRRSLTVQQARKTQGDGDEGEAQPNWPEGGKEHELVKADEEQEAEGEERDVGDEDPSSLPSVSGSVDEEAPIALKSVEAQDQGELGEEHGELGADEISGCQHLDTLCDLQAPTLSCDYRYTNFVEISFPLLKPSAFAKVIGDCPFCLKHRGSVWGLDRLWCTMAADQFADINRSCAILDRNTLVHQNYKTLPKWQDEIWQKMDYYNWGVLNESRSRGREFWVEDVTNLTCSHVLPVAQAQ